MDTTDPIRILQELTSEQILQRLQDLDRQCRFLGVLLRAARLRERDTSNWQSLSAARRQESGVTRG
jgi:hypothetical protein